MSDSDPTVRPKSAECIGGPLDGQVFGVNPDSEDLHLTLRPNPWNEDEFRGHYLLDNGKYRWFPWQGS